MQYFRHIIFSLVIYFIIIYQDIYAIFPPNRSIGELPYYPVLHHQSVYFAYYSVISYSCVPFCSLQWLSLLPCCFCICKVVVFTAYLVFICCLILLLLVFLSQFNCFAYLAASNGVWIMWAIISVCFIDFENVIINPCSATVPI